MFFWNGWWWRPWEGRWYRSRYYNRGWGYYNNVPSFYYDVDPGWRDYYRARNWSGHRWNYERIPHQRLQRNWKQWHANQYWQRNRTWGVESYQPRPQQQIEEIRFQRQEQYRQRPEVQRYQQQIQEHATTTRAQRQQSRQQLKATADAQQQQQQIQEQQRQLKLSSGGQQQKSQAQQACSAARRRAIRNHSGNQNSTRAVHQGREKAAQMQRSRNRNRGSRSREKQCVKVRTQQISIELTRCTFD